jgi:hypothetical protein
VAVVVDAAPAPVVVEPPPKAVAAVVVDAAPEAAAAAGPCPPLAVTVNGKPLKIVTARARRFTRNLGAYEVVLSNAEISCKALLGPSRSIEAGKYDLSIGVGPDPAQRFVFFLNDSKRVETEILSRPDKDGEPIEVCVRELVRLKGGLPFPGGDGEATIQGTVRATLCGAVP